MSRTGNFALGSSSPSETPSLMERAQKFNLADPDKFVANGLNQPYMLAPNGTDAAGAKRMTPNGELPDSNGMALDTYQKKIPSLPSNLNL
jgi:hypothetical protein